MPKAELVAALKAARQEFLAALDGLSDEDMVRPGAVGLWSVKDLLAHLTAWEAEVVTAFSGKLGRAYNHAPEVVQIEDVDDWNEAQYHVSARRPLAIIREDFLGVHKQLIEAIEFLDEKVLDKPVYFEWMEGEPLAYLVWETVIWHEQEHAEDIRAWREHLEDPPPPV